MDFIKHLWLPILLSAFAVWFWAILSCAILTLHKKDWSQLPSEEAFGAAVRPLNLPHGVYGFPYCAHPKQMREAEFMEKWKRGPTGLLYIWNPEPSMGGIMAGTFAVYVAVSFLLAYAGYAAMPHATHSKAFQVMGAMGVAAYGFSFLPNMIWFQSTARAKVTGIVDGIVHGLVTGAIFSALWPA